MKLFSCKSFTWGIYFIDVVGISDYDEDLEFGPSDSELSTLRALGPPEYAQEGLFAPKQDDWDDVELDNPKAVRFIKTTAKILAMYVAFSNIFFW